MPAELFPLQAKIPLHQCNFPNIRASILKNVPTPLSKSDHGLQSVLKDWGGGDTDIVSHNIWRGVRGNVRPYMYMLSGAI